jgi:hypothetical protein
MSDQPAQGFQNSLLQIGPPTLGSLRMGESSLKLRAVQGV